MTSVLGLRILVTEGYKNIISKIYLNYGYVKNSTAVLQAADLKLAAEIWISSGKKVLRKD
jgi:hypothetical protein